MFGAAQRAVATMTAPTETILTRADEALDDAMRRGKKRVESRPQTMLRGLRG